MRKTIKVVIFLNVIIASIIFNEFLNTNKNVFL